MGLIKAAVTATSQVIGDQFKEFITVPQVDDTVLVARGVVNHGAGNRTYTDGVITNGSTIVVPVGFAMLMVENGAIKEFCAEEGTYTWDSAAQPSVFEGGFFKGIGDSIKVIGNRITYGGQAATDQRVYYINTKTILNNKYGSMSPQFYSDPRYGSVELTFNGTYSFRVTDPAILVAKLLGTAAKDQVLVEEVVGEQLKRDFVMALQNCITEFMNGSVSFTQIGTEQMAMCEKLNTLLHDSWVAQYGLSIESVNCSIQPTEESRAIVRNIDQQASLGNMYAQNPSGMMAAATGTAMQNAAQNTNGAMMGFAGMNMAQNAGGSAMTAAQNMTAVEGNVINPSTPVNNDNQQG